MRNIIERNTEESYLGGLSHVLNHGQDREDRTGVGTRSIFGLTMSFEDVAAKFPLPTTKSLMIDSIKSELLWMVEGSGDERRLAEIRYGKDRNQLEDKKTIWTANAHADYWVQRGLKESDGDLGEVYGVQWRHWEDNRIVSLEKGKLLTKRGFKCLFSHGDRYVMTRKIDQLQDVIDGIKKDPFGRRHILTAWNPAKLDDMALPPCHTFVQFYVSADNSTLSCQLYQRSADLFLGSPYNIAFYSMFLAMVANVTGHYVGDLEYRIGDAHIYNNHFDAVMEQLGRAPRKQPSLLVDYKKDIDEYTMDDICLIGYDPHPPIKAPMAV